MTHAPASLGITQHVDMWAPRTSLGPLMQPVAVCRMIPRRFARDIRHLLQFQVDLTWMMVEKKTRGFGAGGGISSQVQ